jgi:hypothetical protein
MNGQSPSTERLSVPEAPSPRKQNLFHLVKSLKPPGETCWLLGPGAKPGLQHVENTYGDQIFAAVLEQALGSRLQHQESRE